jgi:transcriptional regulator with XRE-family HTH domain
MLREEAHVTQEQLAWDCGFAKGFLSQVEAGQSVPSIAALVALAKRLGVDPVDVLAIDVSRKPLHGLVDAARRGDWSAASDYLAILEAARSTHRATKVAESPPPPKRRGKT